VKVMEAANISETSVKFNQTTRRNSSEDSLLYTLHLENLEFDQAHSSLVMKFLTYIELCSPVLPESVEGIELNEACCVYNYMQFYTRSIF
jgi:hypothetical protein